MSLKIVKEGIIDTVQDEGRTEFLHLGINHSGPMDRLSAGLANVLLGKPKTSAVIEMAFPAPSILFERSTIICIAGADFSPAIDEVNIPLNTPVFVAAGSLLVFKNYIKGSWCYLSIFHELFLENWMGSYSTNTKIKAGGYKGRRFRKNDIVLFADPGLKFIARHTMVLHWHANSIYDEAGRDLCFIKGSEWNWLSSEAMEYLEKSYFTVAPQSDRMGYRLEGNALQASVQLQLVSSPVCAGTMQLLPNGQIIVLMADHQTTGGYPRIGYLSSVSIPVLAQQSRGSYIQFKRSTLEDAETALLRKLHYLDDLETTCREKMKSFTHAYLRS
jgi:antagonist of KipI